MKTVRILKNWSWPDLLRQTPGGGGIWEDKWFTTDPINDCDYAIILNRPAEDSVVTCPPGHIWAVIQEPPNEFFHFLHRGEANYARVYTSDPSLKESGYYNSQPALAWHVNKTYDEMATVEIPEKPRSLSWITSNKAVFRGQRRRLKFLEALRGKIDFDLYGYGFNPIEDKWEALAPYRYAMAVENFSNEYYWSEKLADCFLACTMPIYYGCTRISDYFPKESLVQIDIADPEAPDIIQKTIASDRWERNLDALMEARKLVLEKYQLFPFITGEIKEYEQQRDQQAPARASRIVLLSEPQISLTTRDRLQAIWHQVAPKRIRQTGGKIRQIWENNTR